MITRKPSLLPVLKSFFRSLTMMPPGSASLANTPKIERLVVVQHADFGVVRGRLAFVRIVLDEVSGKRSVEPRALVEHAVERDRAARSCGDQLPLETGGLVVDDVGGLGERTCGKPVKTKDTKKARQSPPEAGC